jgi:hypothetical protein
VRHEVKEVVAAKPLESSYVEKTDKELNPDGIFGRGEWIRTTGLLVPNNEDKKNQ